MKTIGLMTAVLVLAAVDDDTLSQSYERNAFTAGSSYARWDWAPIYLSPALLDTEYGENLEIEGLVKTAEVYARVAERVCGVAE